MKTSEQLDKIAPALLAAQSEIRNAAKDSKNPHFKNDYASLESVIEATKGPLNKHGIFISQEVGECREGTLQVTTLLMHHSGQWIEGTASSPVPKLDPQGVGSATTYLRRYSAAAMLYLTQADDDGEAARPQAAPAPIKRATAEQAAALAALAVNPEMKDRITKALAFYKAESFSALAEEHAATILKKLTS